MTRGDVLRYNLAFALGRACKIVRGLRQGLTEAERYAVADHVVTQLKPARRPLASVGGSAAEQTAEHVTKSNAGKTALPVGGKSRRQGRRP